MLIALYFFFINVAIPNVQMYAMALIEPAMVLIITLAGIIMLFGAVGLKISNNLGATVMSGLFKACGYIIRTFIQAIGWIIRNAFHMTPRVYKESQKIYSQMGLNATISNILSLITAFAFIAIII